MTVRFNYGIFQAGLKKSAPLSKRLYDRPQLKLEIEGYVDATQVRRPETHEFNRSQNAETQGNDRPRRNPSPLEEMAIGQANTRNI